MARPKQNFCSKGHEKTEENTGRKSRCNTCHNEWIKNNPESVKNFKLKNRYGITISDFNKILAEQNNSCAICKKKFIGTGKEGPHVDHAHDETKKIRGLLCHKCNIFISYSLESEDILKSAIEYLNKHKE